MIPSWPSPELKWYWSFAESLAAHHCPAPNQHIGVVTVIVAVHPNTDSRVSSPSPPSKVLLPEAAFRSSLPAPPNNWSSPRPLTSTSSPASPAADRCHCPGQTVVAIASFQDVVTVHTVDRVITTHTRIRICPSITHQRIRCFSAFVVHILLVL